MSPCKRCLENNWEYKNLPDDYVKATCQSCGNEFEWQVKKKNWDHGSKCPNCDKLLVAITKPPSKSKLEQAYYFSTFFKCIPCRKIFFNEKYKVHKDI